MRKYVHEAVEGGVEVRSEAHPEPWLLTGDHDLEDNAVSITTLQDALAEARDHLELGAVPGLNGRVVAEELFARHCPKPTGNGERTVAAALDAATASPTALAAAVAFTIRSATPTRPDGGEPRRSRGRAPSGWSPVGVAGRGIHPPPARCHPGTSVHPG